MRDFASVVVGLLLVTSAAACGSAEPIGPHADIDFTMALVSARDGNDEIYGVDATGALINLTGHADHDREPVWSPDGQRIAFTRQNGPAREVMVLDLGRGTVTNVSNDATADDYEPSWAPDGVRLAFTSDRDGNLEIYGVRADGSQLENLTQHAAPDREPRYSPVDDRLAFTSGRDPRSAIYIREEFGGIRRLTTGVEADADHPRWSPLGSWIAFQTNRDGASDIMTVGSTSRIQTEITVDAAHDIQPRWAPDGLALLFLSNRDDTFWDVWLASRDGFSKSRIVGGEPSRDAGAEWSPDGTQIAFESRRAGNWDVYVVDDDGTNLRAITTDAANDGAVAWRPR